MTLARKNSPDSTPGCKPVSDGPPAPRAAKVRAGAVEVPDESRSPANRRHAKRDYTPTGAQLAAQLDEWCHKNDASVVRLSLYLFGSKQGMLSLRRSLRPKTATIAKVRDFLENPPPPERLPERPKARSYAPKINPRPVLDDAVRSARAVQRVKRNIRAQAQRALDAGISPADASPNAGVRGAMKELRENAEAAARATSPVEQAKLIIRRKGHNCFEAWVTLGEKRGRGKFFIDWRLVNEAELLAYAERLRR